MIQPHKDYLRSSLFGIQDALISTGGAVVGIAIGSQDKEFVLMAGLTVVFVEAISMGASEFISDETVHTLDKKDKDNVVISSLLISVSYFIAGLIPISPYIFFPMPQSILLSISFTLIGLIFLGIIKGTISRSSLVRNAIEVLVIGGIVAVIGIMVGYVFKI